MRHERGRGRRRLTPGSTAVTAVVAVLAALLPVGGAAALHQAKLAADAPIPARPASLGSMDFYLHLFGATATGVPVTTTPRGNPVRPVLPDDVQNWRDRGLQPVSLESGRPLAEFVERLAEVCCGAGLQFQSDEEDPFRPGAVSYTHLTLPTSDLV